MPYTLPTAAEFKTRFPTFSAVADATIDAAILEASGSVDETWIEEDYQPAIMLLAAHNLTVEGQGASNEAALSGFSSLSVGPLSISVAQGGSRELPGEIRSTSFGRRYMAILRRNHPGVLAV
jgi:hypothetical protein